MGYEEFKIEGRHPVMEAFRAGRTIDKLFVLDGCEDGPVKSIIRAAKKQDTYIRFVKKERLDQLSETHQHQGVIAVAAAYSYSTVEDILAIARKKKMRSLLSSFWMALRIRIISGRSSERPIWPEPHGVIIPKHRAVGLTGVVAKTSAGALNYTPVAKVANLGQTIDQLKKEGLWFVCGHMGGDVMYRLNLKGPIGLVVGNEGEGVSRLVREKCDYIASIPMKGDIDSLNASVAAGILAYEIVRQRMN